MSASGETARITVQLIISTTGFGDSTELPNNDEITEALWATFNGAHVDVGLPDDVELLAQLIIGRTGELDHPDPKHND